MASGSGRPAKRVKVDYSETFDVLVGTEEEVFTVYKGTITKRAPFFRAALAHDFKEREENRVPLREYDTQTFNIYLSCIYNEAEDVLFVGPRGEPLEQWVQLTKLYILANYLGDVRVCNDVVDHLSTEVSLAPSAKMVELVYDTFPSDHKMREFMIAICMDHCDRHWLPDNRESLPAGFIFEYAVECAKFVDDVRPLLDEKSVEHVNGQEPCHWHEHNEEVSRIECLKRQ